MDLELMINSFPKLLNATVVTLKLLSLSLFFGLFIGLFFAVMRMSKNLILNKFAYGYSYLFRGTPLLVQIFIIYFGFGQIEFIKRKFFMGNIKRTLLVCNNCFCFKYRSLYIRNSKISISNN